MIFQIHNVITTTKKQDTDYKLSTESFGKVKILKDTPQEFEFFQGKLFHIGIIFTFYYATVS